MRKAFTLIELVFVIVIIGILAKFGTNILLTAYTSYAASTTNNKMLGNVELTLKQISNRLQYRLKDSVVVRGPAGFTDLSNADADHTMLEWVGYDIDGWLGSANSTNPTWSGFIDIDDPGSIGSQAVLAASYLESPGTNTNLISTTITSLAADGSDTNINSSAIFFTGANSNVLTDYGWNGVAENNHSITASHHITGDAANVTRLVDNTGVTSFSGTDVYENYKLAWTAYAISIEDFNGDGATYPSGEFQGDLIQDLVLYYDFQPWTGETAAANATPVLLLQNVDTFTFRGIGDTIMIQVCVNDLDALGAADGGYSVCQEIAIF